ncbi:MAG: MoaD/ThiS family protein [Ilumatobacteraceae bacterium]
MATLRLFARAREVAGRSVDTVRPDDSDHETTLTVDDVIAIAVDRYGPDFAALLPTCRIWVNGEPVPGSTPVGETDEVAVLPPVSGG